MTTESARVDLQSPEEALLVLGIGDEHARAVRESLGVALTSEGDAIAIRGPGLAVGGVADRVRSLLEALRGARPPDAAAVQSALLGRPAPTGLFVHGRQVEALGPGQAAYLEAMRAVPLTVVTGTAGTGKTFLAVARACEALQEEEVGRLVFCRPVVEAGERLGYLPGDVEEKMAPYFRPIQDALYRVLGITRTRRLVGTGQIEIAPLAFMRGRTLDEAFILLDEAQNTTRSQMRMFLTRLGVGARAVVTGDPTQSDLPSGSPTGLAMALRRLGGVEGVALVALGAEDVVRHPLVARLDAALREEGS